MNIKEVTEKIHKEHFDRKSMSQQEAIQLLYPIDLEKGIRFIRECSDEELLLVIATFSPFDEHGACVMAKASQSKNGFGKILEKTLIQADILGPIKRAYDKSKEKGEI